MLVAVAASVGVSLASESGSATPAASTAATSTAPVEKRDLVATTSVDGTLGYADGWTMSSRLAGTLTWLAAEGAVVQPGHRLFAVDGNPTVLMRGRVPAYRVLQVGVDGPDVRQLERELRRLGYSGFTVDTSYTTATAAAVKDWQDDLGVAQTGVVDVGAVVFAAGPVRVGAHAVEVGAAVAPGGAVTAVSSTSRVVSVDLPV
ncbi:MAG: hypothetical protein QOJ03_2802, partial [Frankiaceae bacterium]|nr:hypothetical protein [Frankiaceae bacterium]